MLFTELFWPHLVNSILEFFRGNYLKRNWGGEYENVAILIAMAVNEDGYREVIGADEGMKEDKSSWLERTA